MATQSLSQRGIRESLTKNAPLPLTKKDHARWKTSTQKLIHKQLREKSAQNTRKKHEHNSPLTESLQDGPKDSRTLA